MTDLSSTGRYRVRSTFDVGFVEGCRFGVESENGGSAGEGMLGICSFVALIGEWNDRFESSVPFPDIEKSVSVSSHNLSEQRRGKLTLLRELDLLDHNRHLRPCTCYSLRISDSAYSLTVQMRPTCSCHLASKSGFFPKSNLPAHLQVLISSTASLRSLDLVSTVVVLEVLLSFL